MLRCALTRLPTRILLQEHARMAVNRARRSDRQVALVHLGLDDFRLVNDSLGREAGDRVLREAAERLVATLPDVLVLARVGGDEFCALIADLGPDAETVTESVAGHMRSSLQKPFEIGGRRFELGATMGASRFPADAGDVETLFKHAEAAMRQAKDFERGSLVCYAGGTSDALERLLITDRLRGALDRDEFVLEYQPIFSLPDGAMLGVEALLRWDDPERGRIAPMRFIPSAEHTGLIDPIGDWVIDTACSQAREWRDQGIALSMAVNVSLRQFRSPGFASRLLERLEHHGVAPEDLVVEVTETTAMREADCVEPILQDLHDMGIRVAIDDFGIGYSSLGRLRDMTVDILKIDGTFLPRDEDDRRAGRLLAASLDLVEALGMTGVVEGVETAAHHRLLSDRGHACLVQGFHFARPLPPQRVAALARYGAEAGSGSPRS